MSLFVIFSASMGVRPPCSINVQSASEAAMADVQPNVRYRGFGDDVFASGRSDGV